MSPTSSSHTAEDAEGGSTDGARTANPSEGVIDPSLMSAGETKAAGSTSESTHAAEKAQDNAAVKAAQAAVEALLKYESERAKDAAPSVHAEAKKASDADESPARADVVANSVEQPRTVSPGSVPPSENPPVLSDETILGAYTQEPSQESADSEEPLMLNAGTHIAAVLPLTAADNW